MQPAQALRQFEKFLRGRTLRMTSQRRAILELAWGTHEHFTAEEMYAWARTLDASVSRATVYRTLSLLVDGEFLATLDRGHGQTLYEHILGHRHHDHMVCLLCGRILEFLSEEIERLQDEVAARHQFTITQHTLRLEGRCARCSAACAASDSAPPSEAAAD